MIDTIQSCTLVALVVACLSQVAICRLILRRLRVCEEVVARLGLIHAMMLRK